MSALAGSGGPPLRRSGTAGRTREQRGSLRRSVRCWTPHLTHLRRSSSWRRTCTGKRKDTDSPTATSRGEVLAALALTEPDHGSDSVSLETEARRDGGEWVLSDAKRWIGTGAS